MGTQHGRRRGGRGGRHRDARRPLVLLRRNEPRRSSRAAALPAPTPAALVGIAVLVLIGRGAVHLSGSGSAVPLDEAATVSPPVVGSTRPPPQSQGRRPRRRCPLWRAGRPLRSARTGPDPPA